jgi:hypothetical protein
LRRDDADHVRDVMVEFLADRRQPCAVVRAGDDPVVELDDFGVLASCMAGPAANMPPECGCADLDGDGDVDLADFAESRATFVSP